MYPQNEGDVFMGCCYCIVMLTFVIISLFRPYNLRNQIDTTVTEFSNATDLANGLNITKQLF